MKEILLTGSSGLVCSRFIELYGKEYKLAIPDYPEFDLTNSENVRKTISEINPEVIVNFAAYTNVSEAENQRDDKNGDCWKINVEGIKNLINTLNPQIRFIQISTDMVFPGSEENPGPYKESHKSETDSKKVTWYGFTKGEGERMVLEKLGSDATVLRLIYPVRAKFEAKADYIRKPLALFDEGKLYPLFNDQQVSIAFIDEVALALKTIIDKDAKGIFHASSCNTTTPYELISYVIEKVRGKTGVVQTSSLKEFLKKADNPVRYPMFGGLKVESTEKELGIKYNNWKEIVDELISQGLGA
jgi:dTDP-4-dehydrorhamnose reductase